MIQTMRMHRAYVQSLMAAASAAPSTCQFLLRARGKPQMVGAPLAPVSITLFAQGDRAWRPAAGCSYPSTPVRTGRPSGARAYCARLPFDQLVQGDHASLRSAGRDVPSTPVRTGKPGWNPYVDPLTAFDPCPHRETPQLRHASSQTTLRPLFAQGDLGSPLARGS